jgi:hypothetical protein
MPGNGDNDPVTFNIFTGEGEQGEEIDLSDEEAARLSGADDEEIKRAIKRDKKRRKKEAKEKKKKEKKEK